MIHITIDGPSGAGKSTVAKAVAKELGIIYLDTGAIYRAFAYAAMKDGIDVKDGGAVEKFLKNTDIEVKYSDGKTLKKFNIESKYSDEKKDGGTDEKTLKKSDIESKYSDEKKGGGTDGKTLKKSDIEGRYSYEKKGGGDRVQRVFCNKTDVTDFIREHSVSKAASDISKHIPVRIRLSEIQREIAKKYDVVLDGRDAGTFVLPDANFKFFLTADIKVRAERRYAELKEKGGELAFERVLEDIKLRDFNDSNRLFAPLKPASDARHIDSTNMTADEVAKLIIKYVNEND